MKNNWITKILSLIVLIIFCPYSANAAKIMNNSDNVFTISCEGKINSVNSGSWGTETTSDRFSEDLKIIALDNKKIFSVEIEDSTDYYARDMIYFFGANLKTVSNGKTLIMKSKEVVSDDGDLIRKNTKMRLSITNGTYNGEFDIIWKDGSAKRFKTIDAVCSGTDRLLAYINEEKEIDPLPKIKDEEIVPASSGTGFFVSKKSHIITNFHVIENASEIEITTNDNKTFVAEVIGEQVKIVQTQTQ